MEIYFLRGLSDVYICWLEVCALSVFDWIGILPCHRDVKLGIDRGLGVLCLADPLFVS